MSQCDEFEKWAREPPREWSVERLPESSTWHGKYSAYYVYCAWEAWQEATKRAKK